MPRHVVLLTRDASLVVAVKALLGDEDRVSEIESPEELPSVGELPVDAVVVDLPGPSRKASVERVRGRFSGPLVVLLGHGEDPAKARVAFRCNILTRPFGMSQLWSMLADSATEAVTEVIPAIRRDAHAPAQGPSGPPHERAAPPTAPEPPAQASGHHERVERPDRPTPPAPERPARVADQPALASERPARVANQPALAPERHSRPTERPPAAGPERPPAAAPQRPAASAPGRPAAPVGERGAPSAPPARAERGPAPPPTVSGRAARGGAASGARPERAANEGGRAAAWSWRLRRFQQPEARAANPGELTQPMPAVPPAPDANGAAPAADRVKRPPEAEPARAASPPVQPEVQARPPAPPRASAEEQVMPDPPETVAGRLAERLGADTVALLLDNNRGLLEVAGGVGLTASERQLQVEYGHEVLLELFRVGVGLIEDTERVRPLIRGIPGSRSQSLVMVPLVHEGHGFGALIIGRTSPPGQPRPEFTEPEIEALMDFAEDVAAPLRSTVLLRRLKGQLNIPDRT